MKWYKKQMNAILAKQEEPTEKDENAPAKDIPGHTFDAGKKASFKPAFQNPVVPRTRGRMKTGTK